MDMKIYQENCQEKYQININGKIFNVLDKNIDVFYPLLAKVDNRYGTGRLNGKNRVSIGTRK